MCRSVKQEDSHVQEIHCSRERSRAAWSIIDEVQGSAEFAHNSEQLKIFFFECRIGNSIVSRFMIAVSNAICGTRKVSNFTAL